ncbi:hypothetical protein [Pseudomonas phage Nerthus]|uniref:Uncharacterized protein n=1 Tax=Pseudomonas phage Nerthus TaxID=2163984 RepID=A0A2S1GMR8_9CAUD|nr:hypothetical protein HOT09_gp11 [Pseudomonas phage Nerthus]AWD90643.1 hypothetical protein [Pseudomonas phage Nerthus]
MNSAILKDHLTNLLMGKTTVADLQADGSPEALEAVTISARNFNDVTMQARGIHEAMTSTFITKIKASGQTLDLLRLHGIDKKDGIKLLGKVYRFEINWGWTSQSQVYLRILTPIPGGLNGYAIPLGAVLQDFDASQCRKLAKWVLSRAAIVQQS